MNNITETIANNNGEIQKKILRIALPTLFIFSLSVFSMYGQNISKLKNQSWMKIMQNDTSINFFKAKKDYVKFKKVYKKQEAKQEAREKKDIPKHSPPNEEHLESPEASLMMAYEKWERSMRPFVTKDGKVMPVEQRLKMVQNKKQE